MTISQKLISFFVGAFMLLGGINKFREPFTTMFREQIALAELPLPLLSNWSGKLGEIIAGASLVFLVIFWKKLSPILAGKTFYFANLLVIIVMAVATYVHLHPAVPADILPWESKPPITPVVTLLLAALNIYLHRIKQQ